MTPRFARNAIALLAAGVLSLSALGQQASAPSAMSSVGSGSQQMHEQMMKGMQSTQSMPMSGNTDRDFASMMRMHHQQAIDMARAELEHGKSAEMKAMARKLIREQQKEIAQFDKYLAKNN